MIFNSARDEAENHGVIEPGIVRFCLRRGGTVIGVALALVGVLQYESENAAILGRWSVPLFVFAAAMGLLWLFMLAQALRRPRPMPRGRVDLLRAIALDLAVGVWGVAYLLAAADSPAAGANLLSGNLFGSAVPMAVALHFIALTLLFIAATTLVKRLRDHGQNFVLTAVAIGVGLLIAEAWVRFRALVAPTTQGFPTYTSALWDRRYVTRNALGFRDREHELVADTGTRRVLLVGDSYVFGTGIKRPEDRFGEQLELRLGAVTATTWEVINAGQPDRHTLHETQTLRCMLPYRPDVVLLLYVFNDVDYIRPVTPREGLSEAPSGLLQRLHPARVLYANFFLFQEMYLRLRALSFARDANPAVDRDPYLDEALLTRHLKDVRAFIDIAASAGAEVMVVPFDIGIAHAGPLRSRYQRFVAAAEVLGIPVTSLEPAFARRNYSRLFVSALDRHPNELAHRLAADVVAPVVAARMRPIRDRHVGPALGATVHRSCLP